MALKLSGLARREKAHENQKGCCSAVVAAGGASSRMEGQDKLFLDIGGVPVLAHTLLALNKCPEVGEIVVVTRQDRMDDVARLVSEYGVSKAAKLVPGGQTRLESVMNGVLQVSPHARLIAVHDGARPFVTGETVSLAVAAALKFSAAAPAVPVTSTVKMAKNNMVVKTVDRDGLFEIQTPQIFAAELLKGALQNAADKKLYITDDCMAVEALGCSVCLTAGTRENIKLTTAIDVAFAEAILQMRRKEDEDRTRL
ncbi:2-C-methyl-D-erythritol 4-phosphate cytidylyltransferase [Sporobacter termitidis DSM 10068]|uniref:2-C-methyl-D-erythritol 4-phosphate cytidylyltransferase n=1 Tax=Sporobacter termitidis DSM 10068 TaxID=1123282 RepID=A0A1M5TIN6_9FIRM|nr:2-C-methyl-D-erythritol 4-phosphate cytidylyltransferase [Sporobacter termitidis]SHH50632.1 2-C-methyl-D-erythritol 4-phosphate cytidylyltransferase [Sporobacter termitidis DSM 10068]